MPTVGTPKVQPYSILYYYYFTFVLDLLIPRNSEHSNAGKFAEVFLY